MPDVSLGYAPFAAQQAYFRRKINVPTARWDDLQHGDHAHGFMVAGLTRLDVLDDIRKAVQDALDKGETIDDFRKKFDQAVAGRWTGWTGEGSAKGRAWRTSIIYETNLRTSYMAGRWETLKNFPYLRYQHNFAVHPRMDHVSWSGMILPTNDPWWNTHYPPNGWRCHCTVTGVSEARLRALKGDAGPDTAPGPSPDDPPPEWAYHVGKESRSAAAASRFGEKVMQLPPSWRDIALNDAQARTVNWFGNQWSDTVDAIADQAARGGPMLDMQRRGTPVAFWRPDTLQKAEQIIEALPQNIQPAMPTNAAIFGGDEFIAHVVRDLPAGAEGAAFLKALKDVPTWLADDATMYVLDAHQDQALIAIRPGPDGRYWKLVMLPKRMRMDRAAVEAYHLTTLELMQWEQLRGFDLLRYGAGRGQQ